MATIEDSNCCGELVSGQFASDKGPIEYFTRFSLCVLDVVRKLQQHSVFEKGVEKCHIVEYLRHQ